MFLHQDIELGSDDWLLKVEKMLDSIPDIGVAGVAGMSQHGLDNKERGRGYINNGGQIWIWSNSIEKPEQVQTVDECVLIIPKTVFDKYQFDEINFDGWHCYGVDFCLSLASKGLKTYVIPAFVYHRSLTINQKALEKYQKRLLTKYGRHFKHIYTTCGNLSNSTSIILLLLKPFSFVYRKCIPNFEDILKKEIGDKMTVLDLGCGYNSPLQRCKKTFSVGIEIFAPYLEESKKKGIHDAYIMADIRSLNLKPKSFDIVLASELLEHFTKAEGYQLIQKMQQWATRKIIITTPNGFLIQNEYDGNLLQKHRSGWTVNEFYNLGFKINGINGFKKIARVNNPAPSFGTKEHLRLILLELTQGLTYFFPKLSFQLFAVKEIKE